MKFRFDSFELDEADARLRRDGAPVSLAPRAFGVLCALARKPGVLVTKNDLLDAVWGHQHVSESVLKTIISELRAALGDDAKQPKYIETASRRGYRFIGKTGEAVPAAVPDLLPDRPAPQRVAQAPSPLLIGRDAALARLRAAWKRAISGERQLVWIAGEAGIGKTRLIQSFLSELEPSTATFGQCVEHFGTGEPYLPLLEAVKELCRREPALVPIMRAVAPTWLVQMPWLVNEADRANLQREVAGAHQDRMVREMREMMDRYTANRPLVFVLEDLHWCDHGTLRMMEHFARRPREVRILWIASFRLTQVIAEDHPLRELRQELRLHNLCEEILLEPFSEADVAAYMADRMPDTRLPEAFVRRLHSHTDGLPLFVANVVDTLNPATIASWMDASSATPLPVPDSLAGVIEKQIGRLPAETQALLEAASISGMEFRASAVAGMLGRDANAVSQQCDDLVRRKFWLRHVDLIELPDGSFDTRYAFLHALYQHVFYQRLSIPQRVQFHRRAAQGLESLRATGQLAAPTELASHFERGLQPLQALRYYAEAAEIAIAHFAPMEALNITTRALALLGRCPESPERMEVELALVHKRGLACGHLHGIGAADTVSAFERARALCDALPETPARAVLLNGLGLTRYVLGDYPQASAIAERVRALGERYGHPVLPVCAYLLRGMVHAVQGEYSEARESLEKGIAICEQTGERIPFEHFVIDPLVSLRANLAPPLVYLGCPDQARNHLALAGERARKLGQPTARMLVSWVSGMVEARLSDARSVATHAQVLGRIVEEAMLMQGEGPAKWLRGWAMAHLGSPLDGFRLIREGYESHARLGMYAGNTETLGYAADALILAGDLAGAERQIEEALELAQRFKERSELPNLLLLSARVALARGDVASARGYVRDAVSEGRARRSPYFEVKALTALCELPDASGDDLESLKKAFTAMPEGHSSLLGARAARLVQR